MKSSIVLPALTALGLSATAHAGALEDYERLNKAGKKQEAIAALEKGADATPPDCKVLRTLGDAYTASKDEDLATITYEKFLKNCASDPEAKRIRGAVDKHFEAKSNAGAPPDDAGPGGMYLAPLPAQKLHAAGRTEEDAWSEEEDFWFTKGGNPEFVQGIELMRASKFKEAVGNFETFIKKEPKHAAPAYKFMATAKAQLGDVDGAVKAYEQYLKLSPNAPDADPIRRSLNFQKSKPK